MKLIWHGSTKHGETSINNNCNGWRSHTPRFFGMASHLGSLQLLSQEKVACDNPLIVLCIETTSTLPKRRRRDTTHQIPVPEVPPNIKSSEGATAGATNRNTTVNRVVKDTLGTIKHGIRIGDDDDSLIVKKRKLIDNRDQYNTHKCNISIESILKNEPIMNDEKIIKTKNENRRVNENVTNTESKNIRKPNKVDVKKLKTKEILNENNY